MTDINLKETEKSDSTPVDGFMCSLQIGSLSEKCVPMVLYHGASSSIHTKLKWLEFSWPISLYAECIAE